MSTKAASRDVRLDFFRGMGMFIIFVAHLPWNPWALWIPARFGFSDATEIFVFCSGMASAIAFGAVYEMRGWLMGTARVAFRIWQVYWAHVALFLVIAAMLVAIDDALDLDRIHIKKLNLVPFFNNPDTNLVGLLTLTYVPNYFDILPMYIGILFMLPVVMGLARISPLASGVFVVAVWLCANFDLLKLPAEPWSQRAWFFNPFGWQLVFFTGFAFVRGWIKPPPVDARLVVVCIAIVLCTVPFAYFKLLKAFEVLKEASIALKPFTEKSDFGVLRYIHFLALAYLAWAAAGPNGANLKVGMVWTRVVDIVRLVGQQSLAVFVTSLVIAQAMGVILDLSGRNLLTVALANLTGFALLVATAKITSFFKSEPWRSRPAKDKQAPTESKDIAESDGHRTRREASTISAT